MTFAISTIGIKVKQATVALVIKILQKIYRLFLFRLGRGFGTSFTNSLKKLNFNPKDFNPLLYDFDFDKNQIYRVDGTDYIINIIPKQLK